MLDLILIINHANLYDYAVINLHDLQSEGLSRRLAIKMVETAGGGQITNLQARYMWDQTILPYGKKNGLLSGYVTIQAGTSKRTAAGAEELQRQWHVTVTTLIERMRTRAKTVLQDDDLVNKILPFLLYNLDEESLQAMGKNGKVVGTKEKKKHDNQNASSRFVAIV